MAGGLIVPNATSSCVLGQPRSSIASQKAHTLMYSSCRVFSAHSHNTVLSNHFMVQSDHMLFSSWISFQSLSFTSIYHSSACLLSRHPTSCRTVPNSCYPPISKVLQHALAPRQIHLASETSIPRGALRGKSILQTGLIITVFIKRLSPGDYLNLLVQTLGFMWSRKKRISQVNISTID